MEVIKQTTHNNMNIVYANIKLKLNLAYVVVSHIQFCHLTFSIVYVQHLAKIYKSIYPKNKWKLMHKVQRLIFSTVHGNCEICIFHYLIIATWGWFEWIMGMNNQI